MIKKLAFIENSILFAPIAKRDNLPQAKFLMNKNIQFLISIACPLHFPDSELV
jgi:hypothetical protein